MDLVRLDTLNSGVVYMRASALFSLAVLTTEDPSVKHVNVRFISEAGQITDLHMAGDVDEVAAMFESIRGWDIYRLV